MIRALLPFCLLGLPAFAACPPGSDTSAEADRLFAEIQAAQGELTARAAADGLWRIWTAAPDQQAQGLLDDGMRRIREADWLGAVKTLDDLIAYCPDYAEGYNQRAIANFLRQDYRSALEDIEEALDREPRHFGALTGKALTLMGAGRMAEAQLALRAALKVNPWLAERQLLVEPPGEDL